MNIKHIIRILTRATFQQPYMKGQKHIAPMVFGEYLRKPGFQRTVIDFMKGIVILIKVDEIFNILKCLLATGY